VTGQVIKYAIVSTARAGENAGVNAGENAGVSSLEQQIMSAIAKNNTVTYSELALLLAKNESTIYRRLKSLKSRGILRREGSDKAGCWVIINSD
jgi:predicted HTH transcriptional regulator